MSSEPGAAAYIFARNGVNNIIGRCTEKLRDDGELVDVIFSWEQWLPFQHLCEDTTSTPNVDFHVVLLPRKHDLWGSVISR